MTFIIGLLRWEDCLSVKCIRETLKTVSARGVELKRYNNEIFPYKIPAMIAGIAMKKLFSHL